MLRGKEAGVERIRETYRAEVGHDWPHDDSYLRDLTREASSREELRSLMMDTDTRLGDRLNCRSQRGGT